MAQEISCPACGAPLEIAGDETTVRCGFCGTELEVVFNEGLVEYKILSQPTSLKEDFARPERISEILAEEKPVAPGSPTFFAGQSEPAPFTLPVESPVPGAQVYLTAEAPARRSSRTWIWIGVAIIVMLMFLCACLAMVALFAIRTSNG